MKMNSATLPHRVFSLLRAKQFLVFYAVGLYVLDLAPGLLAAWVAGHRPLATILGSDTSLIGAAIRARHASGSLAVAVLVLVLALGLSAFFRAGYLRSLVGKLHVGPVDGAQFLSMAGLTLLMLLIDWAAGAGYAWSGAGAARSTLVEVARLTANLVVLYADYVIVVCGLRLGRAIVQSLRTVRANPALSVGVLLAFVLVSWYFIAAIRPEIRGPASSFAPLLVVWALVLGSLSFVVDVVLIMVYIDSIERGRIVNARRE